MSEPGANGVWGVGIYENEYVKEGGVWKIAKLHFYPTAFTDYDKGWARSLLPMKGQSALFPPDKPPTKVYRTMPGNYIPPFSFKHPVTGEPLTDLPQAVDSVMGRMIMTKRMLLSRPAIEGSALIPLWLRRCSLPPRPAFAQSAAERLDALDARITRLEDMNQIERLQRTYGYFVDKSQWTQLSELFSDDATLEIGGKGLFLGQAPRAGVHADRIRARRREGRLARQSHAVPVDPRHLGGWQDGLDPLARVCDEPRWLGPAVV